VINIYIHVAVIGNVNLVLQNLFFNIVRSGLYEASNKIILSINGDIGKLYIPYLINYQKCEVLHLSNDYNKYEFPTLHHLWKESKNDEFKILYLHTKGVSKAKNKYVKDWVEYLSYFNVQLWQDRLIDLRQFDCVGVNIKGSQNNSINNASQWFSKGPPLHYSGNFWWANSNYIKRLPNPYEYKTDQSEMLRYYCEMWLLQLKGKFHCAWYSGVLHHKDEPYPAFMYRKELRYKYMRFFFEKVFRVYVQIIRYCKAKK
jgi:hypothetical protein